MELLDGCELPLVHELEFLPVHIRPPEVLVLGEHDPFEVVGICRSELSPQVSLYAAVQSEAHKAALVMSDEFLRFGFVEQFQRHRHFEPVLENDRAAVDFIQVVLNENQFVPASAQLFYAFKQASHRNSQ